MSNPPPSIFVRVAVIATIVCWLPLLITPAIIMLGSFKQIISSGIIAVIFAFVVVATVVMIAYTGAKYSPFGTKKRSLRAYVWRSLIIQLRANTIAIISQAIGTIFSAAGLVDWFSLSASAIGFGCVCVVAAIVALIMLIVSKSRAVANFVIV